MRSKLVTVLIMGMLNVVSIQAAMLEKIEVKGNQRINSSAVVEYSQAKKGQKLDEEAVEKIIQALYSSKQFSHVEVVRGHNKQTLVIKVKERPIIHRIEIVKNNLVPDEAIKSMLKKAQLEAGKVFNPEPLHEVKYGLKEAYHLQGYPNMLIEQTVEQLPRNRVDIKLKVIKKEQSRVRNVQLQGNIAFKKRVLVEKLGFNTPSLYAMILGGNYYSEIALERSLSNLKAWYEANGYLEMQVKAVKVSKAAGKNLVDVSIAIHEGPRYTLKMLVVDGDKQVMQTNYPQVDQIKAAMQSKQVPFTRQRIQALMLGVRDALEKKKYPVAGVEPKVSVDEKDHTVRVALVVKKGTPITVRRIHIRGNSFTLDKVLRREMALSEGEVFSQYGAEESKRRIANLSYLKNVGYEVLPVGKDNKMVDVVFQVEESRAATLHMDLSKADKENLAGSVGLNHTNFMGTGNSVNIKLEKVYKGRTSAILGGYMPFVFKNGLGMGYNFSYQRKKPGEGNSQIDAVSDQDANRTLAAALLFNLPLTTYTDLDINLKAQNHHFTDIDKSSISNKAFIEEGGKNQNEFTAQAIWRYRTIDRYDLPTRGQILELDLTGGVFGKTNYYILHTRGSWYWKHELSTLTFNPRVHLAVGQGFKSYREVYKRLRGSDIGYSSLPPMRKLYGGGTDPVRGMMTFGDKALVGTGSSALVQAIGGDVLTTASMNIYVPKVFNGALQPSLFVDGGYVYSSNEFSLQKWVSSAGVQLDLKTPIAPLTFIYAVPLKMNKTGSLKDSFRNFQFSLQTTLY